MPCIFDRYERFRCWNKFTAPIDKGVNDFGNIAVKMESAMRGADPSTVTGSILFPCAARLAAIKARKERVLAYEAELLTVLSASADAVQDIEAGGTGGFEAVVTEAIQAAAKVARNAAVDAATKIKYLTFHIQSTQEKLKRKHLKEGDEVLICKCKQPSFNVGATMQHIILPWTPDELLL